MKVQLIDCKTGEVIRKMNLPTSFYPTSLVIEHKGKFYKGLQYRIGEDSKVRFYVEETTEVNSYISFPFDGKFRKAARERDEAQRKNKPTTTTGSFTSKAMRTAREERGEVTAIVTGKQI